MEIFIKQPIHCPRLSDFKDEKCTYSRLQTVQLSVALRHNINVLSILRSLIKILSPAHAKERSLNGFKFGTFIGRFLSDGRASRAVTG